MKLLDLFCCAGGAGMGYHRAGFDVTGVDIAPQPRYPFAFVQADALDYLAEHGHEYDVIHASPPCQFYSSMTHCRPRVAKQYPDLISETRKLLQAIGKPYVIENVSGARSELNAAIMLCGKSFGLKVYRHRYFETCPWMMAPSHIPHRDNTPKAGRGTSRKGFVSVAGKGGLKGTKELWARSMGIDWMTLTELAEAIPPAYTEWIGRQLLAVLNA